MYMCMYVYVFVCMCMYMYVSVCICMYVCMYRARVAHREQIEPQLSERRPQPSVLLRLPGTGDFVGDASTHGACCGLVGALFVL